MKFDCGLSTEDLLHLNPIELVRLHDIDDIRGDYRYDAVRISDGIVVGGTRLNFFTDDTKEMGRPYIYKDFLGKGLGLAMYVAANRIPHDNGDNYQLQSQLMFLSESAERVWKSLVRRGIAEVIQTPGISYKRYKFLSTKI